MNPVGSSRRLALLWLLVAHLLFGQQAALAHMIGHIGGEPSVALVSDMVDGDDSEHGAAEILSHVCTTCAAFAGLDLALQRQATACVDVVNPLLAARTAVPPAPTFAHPAAFQSRAPPAFRN